MTESFRGDGDAQKPRTTREIIDGMPTPGTAGETLALFAALEFEAVEQGRRTAEEAKEVLAETFRPPVAADEPK